MKRICVLLFFVLLGGCLSAPAPLESLETIRAVASTARPGKVSVLLPGTNREIEAGSLEFPASNQLTEAQLEELKGFLANNWTSLGPDGRVASTLRFMNQIQRGPQLYVRFQQVFARKISGRVYYLPLEGAGLLALLENGKVTEIRSNLKNPPEFQFQRRQSGFKLDFSDTEMAAFISHVKTSPDVRVDFQKSIEEVARRSNQPFDFARFLNREVVEQRELLNQLFGKIGPKATARILVQLTVGEKLSLVPFKDEWTLQADGVFGIPMQFDIIVPGQNETLFLFRHLREQRAHAQVLSFTSPHFPGGKKLPEGEQAKVAAEKMKSVVDYFSRSHDWPSYLGPKRDQKQEGEVVIHTQLKSIDFKENAAWLGQRKVFVVGEGGTNLNQIHSSIGVLGHEYTHAIVQFSSALTYKGESGAINEHVSDIQGAMIEADAAGGTRFSHSIGSDVLTPQVRKEKAALTDLIFDKYKFSSSEIHKFNLGQPSLRNFYAPVLSFASQVSHFDEYLKQFPRDCQPSLDNDNCGVHSGSGVLNRAASLIIESLGLSDARKLFFNTAVYRLGASSNFADYREQLLQECLATPEISRKCSLIDASFAQVGITRATSSSTSPAQQSGGELKIAATLTGGSPSLKFCGWVDTRLPDRIQIIDEKFNANVIKRNFPVKTIGESQGLEKLECACVTGRIVQVSKEDGQIFNGFSEITKIEDRKSACANDSRMAARKPPVERPLPPRPSEPKLYCGWVSINSRSRNITIIDNRYDVAFLVSGYKTLTVGQSAPLSKIQCACVEGQVSQTENSKGTTFNYFTRLTTRGVVPRPPEACIGLQWK